MSTLHGQREERFSVLFDGAYCDVLRFAQRRLHSSHAEEAVAEAFMVAWRRIDEAPRRPGEARAWLFGITRNCLLNARRSQDRQDALAVRIRDTAPSPSGQGLEPDLAAQWLDLVAAWRALSAGEQEVLALAVFDDLSSPQAARVIGVTPAAYRLRLMRARRALRRHLDAADAPSATDPAIQESTS